MKKRILQVRFHTAMHHGSGFGLVGIVDQTVLRDCDGMPYLAGSSLKGRLRHAALRVLLSSGKPACEYGSQSVVCDGSDSCSVCFLFGSRLRQGYLLNFRCLSIHRRSQNA